MRIKNYTNVATSTIREMVRFAVPPGVAGFDVRVNNTGARFRGRAYAEGNSIHDRPCPFIIVSIGRSERLPPIDVRHRGGYLPMPAMSREEMLLVLLAHELRHLWQGRVKRGRRVYGARGQYSERDADAYALRALRHWRRGEPMSKGGN